MIASMWPGLRTANSSSERPWRAGTGDLATQQQGQVVLGPFDNDRPTARQSFRKFADIDVDTVCFGHGQPLVGEETDKLKAAGKADEVPDPLG